MSQILKQAEVQIGAQGEVVIPVALLEALGSEPGEILLARIEDERLVFEKRESIIARLHAHFAQIPTDISLSDELIAERRAEAYKDRER